MKGTVWRLYLGIGALATGAYFLLSPGAGAVLNVVVGASAAAAILAGARWHRPARRLAWWLIAAAQGLFAAGDALFSINELVLKIEPFPSLAGALYLSGYPVLAAGPALLALSRAVGRDWAGLSEPARRRQARLGRGRLAMGAAALVAPALLIVQRLQGSDIEVAAIAGAWAVLFVLILTRIAGLVRGLERAEADRRRVLDRTVHAAEAAGADGVAAPPDPGRGRPGGGPARPPGRVRPPLRGWTARSGSTWTAGSTGSWRRSSTGSPRRRC